jgi:hypothetical protein
LKNVDKKMGALGCLWNASDPTPTSFLPVYIISERYAFDEKVKNAQIFEKWIEEGL